MVGHAIQFNSFYLFCALKRKNTTIYMTKKVLESTGKQRNDHTGF